MPRDYRARIRESVLAGVWRVQYLDGNGAVQRDVVEIADIPGVAKKATFGTAAEALDFSQADIPDTVYNASPMLTEINDRLPDYRPGPVPHVINLSLLPHTSGDVDFLTAMPGSGPVVILSRGNGNCRITSTATRNVWRVKYFNSQEILILNTLEISTVPDVACAAREDVDDSSQRLLLEVQEVYTMNKAFLPGSCGGDTVRLRDDARLACKIPWYVYAPALSDAYWQIPPGTPFSRLPDHRTCPECDGRRDGFMLVED
ncbi:MAG: hydrogenase expression/formation C-terminal domain-containing protein [Gammaproteobacteria bacterium]|jgi:rubredoxin